MTPRVALFIPCFVDQFCPQVGMDMAQVLQRAGCDVYYPEEQTCCGQPAFNTGYWKETIPVAERFLHVFGNAEAVVCPSGSCTTMVRKFYPELLEGRPSLRAAMELGGRVYEFSEYLVEVLKVADLGAEFPHKVTFHDACHALRELHIKKAPRELLKHVRGLELVEMPASEECCGFGGTFAVKFGMISSAMGETKCANAAETGAEYITSGDPSCLMHIEGVLRRRGDAARTIHLASILSNTAAAALRKGA